MTNISKKNPNKFYIKDQTEHEVFDQPFSNLFGREAQ